MRKSVIAALCVALMVGGISGAAASAALPISEIVQKALLNRLPRTKVNKVDCSQVPGLCEIQAGSNVFYVDQTARYLVVGRVFDSCAAAGNQSRYPARRCGLRKCRFVRSRRCTTRGAG